MMTSFSSKKPAAQDEGTATSSQGSSSGGRSFRKTLMFSASSLTREDVREELQRFADGALDVIISDNMDRICEELKHFLQELVLSSDMEVQVPPMDDLSEGQGMPTSNASPHVWLKRNPTHHNRSSTQWFDMRPQPTTQSNNSSTSRSGRTSIASRGRPAKTAGSSGRTVDGLGNNEACNEAIDEEGHRNEVLSRHAGEGTSAKVPEGSKVLRASVLYLSEGSQEQGNSGADPLTKMREQDPRHETQEVQPLIDRVPGDDGTPRHHNWCRPTPRSWTASCSLQSLVTSLSFEHFICILILTNCATLGVETNFHAVHHGSPTPQVLRLSDFCFCICFATELVLRLWAFGLTFFTMKGWRWNVFDFVVVTLQVTEQVCYALVPLNMSLMRMLRVLRLIRIMRLIRVLRLIEELRTMVSSVVSSMKSLCSSLVLLMMMIYSCSVIFTQIVADAIVGGAHHTEELEYWFGDVSRTALTMFETILGGATWDEVVHPLIVEISPAAGVMFCFYVAFCVFALMNVLTGALVDNASHVAQEDKDTNLANHISQLFFKGAEGPVTVITWEVFKSKLDCPDMKEYFKAINVDPSEAQGLFQLLDVDGMGAVDSTQIVSGLLRLRGTAKALELSLLMHETSRMHQRVTDYFTEVTQRLRRMGQVLANHVSGKGSVLANNVVYELPGERSSRVSEDLFGPWPDMLSTPRKPDWPPARLSGRMRQVVGSEPIRGLGAEASRGLVPRRRGSSDLSNFRSSRASSASTPLHFHPLLEEDECRRV